MLRPLPASSGSSVGGYLRAAFPLKRAPHPAADSKKKGNGWFSDRKTLAAASGDISAVRLTRLGRGGVATVVTLKTPNAKLLTSEILRPVERVLNRMVATARKLSKGSFSFKRLRHLGRLHKPKKVTALGVAARLVGVANLGTANKQWVNFERSWSGALEVNSNGVTLRVKNESEIAALLAFGHKKTKSLPLFRAAVRQHMDALRRAWRKVVKQLLRLSNAN